MAKKANLLTNMLFRAPDLDARESDVLNQVEAVKLSLRHQLSEPRRWVGALRRQTFARNLQGSNSIEGYDAVLEDAAAIAAGEEPLDADTETRLALEGYRNAMTFVLQQTDEPNFIYSEQLIKSLHFIMINYDLKSRPGLWRVGPVYVRRESTGEIVHEGAAPELVPSLMTDIVTVLNTDPHLHPMVRAAMAHLNLAMIHPFKDGNGRMARCLQSLVLARQGTVAPVFMSIEEYLGRNTLAYYDVLAQVGGGRWSPERDARPWLRFALTAHLRQARTLLRRVKQGERLWFLIEEVTQARGLPDRCLPAVFDAALGIGIRNATYRASVLAEMEEEITEATASRDLRDLVAAGILVPHGEKRARRYLASKELTELMRTAAAQTGVPRDDSDPFASAA
jgi:Fic family protein